MKRLAGAVLIFAAAGAFAQSDRASSDFEIARAQRELRSSSTAIGRIAARLNLGDLYSSRRQPDAAAREFSAAAREAEALRIEMRKSSDLTRYARATSYSALAHAKLGERTRAFELFTEATRYVADSAATWNLFASAMLSLREFEASAAIARKAVAVAERNHGASPSRENLLDLNVYRYTLASALAGSDSSVEAERILLSIIAALESKAFEETREEVARNEEFEILSTVERESSAYISLLARSRLRLAALYETGGDAKLAREQYAKVLEQRSDEPRALAALARLATAAADRQRLVIEAFDADPFSPELARDYFAALERGETFERSNTAGGRVRAVAEALHKGRVADAEKLLEPLRAEHTENETLLALASLAARAGGRATDAASLTARVKSRSVRDALLTSTSTDLNVAQLLGSGDTVTLSDAQLQSLVLHLRRNQLTPEELTKLDVVSLQQSVRAEDSSSDGTTTTFYRGRIGVVKFRFAAPVSFQGDFSGAAALQMRFRILGWSDDDDGGALLVEPLGVSR